MKIVFFDIGGWEKQYLKQQLKNNELVFFSESLGQGNVDNVNNCEILSVGIYSKINKQLIKKLPKLKLIVTRSTGFDHIDINVCKKENIIVCNAPFYGENTVAEHTFALILSLSRKVHKSYLRITKNDFSITGLKGFDLKGKTLGVIGAGRIGLHVIRIGKGFGMEVLAYDIYQNKFLAEVLDFEYMPLEKLLGQSDIITLHTPYNKLTHHLINKNTIKFIKKGAILINTSRGEVVDTDALIMALDKKILSGAGLDVIEGEEVITEESQLLYKYKKQATMELASEDRALLKRDNVVFTPHIAFYSQEALERIIKTTVENIAAYVGGKSQNVV